MVPSCALGVDLAFTWKAAAIAAAVMGFPLLVRSARLAIELVDPQREEAARTLRRRPASRLPHHHPPLSLPGVLAGIILALARMLGEFGATITFAGNIEGVSPRFPVAIYTYTQTPGGDAPALRLILISIAVSVVALICSELLARRMHHRLGHPG